MKYIGILLIAISALFSSCAKEDVNNDSPTRQELTVIKNLKNYNDTVHFSGATTRGGGRYLYVTMADALAAAEAFNLSFGAAKWFVGATGGSGIILQPVLYAYSQLQLQPECLMELIIARTNRYGSIIRYGLQQLWHCNV